MDNTIKRNLKMTDKQKELYVLLNIEPSSYLRKDSASIAHKKIVRIIETLKFDRQRFLTLSEKQDREIKSYKTTLKYILQSNQEL